MTDPVITPPSWDASSRPNRDGPLNLSIFLATLITAISLCVPFRTLDFYQINFLDYSWQLILHWAAANHLRFGRDLVFTYGPYGFIATNVFHPDTYLHLMLVRTAIVLAFVGTLWTIGAKLITSRLILFIWLISIVLMIGESTDVLFVAVCVALFVAYFYVFEGVFPARLIPLIPVLSLLALTKFTLLLTGGVVLGAIAIDQAARGNRMKAIAILMAHGIGIGVLWLLAGQKLRDLWPFTVNSLAISRGYSEAMAVAGPTGDIFDFFAGAIPLVLVVAIAGWLARRWWGMLPATAISIILFLVFKDAFVRHDDLHAPRGGALVFIFAILFAPGLWRLLPESVRAMGCVAVLMLAGMCSSSILARNISRSVPRNCVRNAKIAAMGLIDIAEVIASKNPGRERYDAAFDEMRTRAPLPLVTGPTDMYGYHQAFLIAHHLNYSPHPVMQSYAAYIPSLASLDARRLLSESAPRNLFLDFDNFGDDRFPTLSDNTSLPEILAGYEPRSSSTNLTKYPLLVKRNVPRISTWTRFSVSTVGFGQTMEVHAPLDSLVWATIEVHPTFLWNLAALVYKPPVLWIDVTTHDGAIHSYRLIASMAEEGFILSPLVESSQDFLDLYTLDSSHRPRGNGIRRISVSARDGPWNGPFFKPDIDVRLYRLDFKDR